MLILKTITLTGFGPYRDETKFKLDRPGVNIIIADNGVGKTTLVSAISWVLFEKAMKDIKDVSTWVPLRDENYKGTKIELKVDKEGVKYIIARYKDYKGPGIDGIKGNNRIILWDGKENLLKDNKKTNQENLCKFLGFTHDVFVNSTVFGQRTKRIISSSGPDKKALFEEVFNASFIQEAREKVKVDFDTTTQLVSQISTNLHIKKEVLKSKKQTLAFMKDQRDTKVKDNTEAIQRVSRSIKALEDEAKKELTDLPQKVEALRKKKEALNKSKWELENQINRDKSQGLANELRELKTRHIELINQKTRLENVYNDAYNKHNHYQKDHKDTKDTCEYCGTALKDVGRAKLLKQYAKTRDEAHNQLDVIEPIIFDVVSKMKKLNLGITEITRKGAGFKQEFKKVEGEIQELDKGIKIYNDLILTQTSNQEKYKNLKEYKKELEEFTPPKPPKGLIREIKELSLNVEDYERELVTHQELLDNLKWLTNDLLGNKGLKAYIFDSMLNNLNKLLAYYEQFIGFGVEFKVDLDGGNKDIYAVCYRDGYPAMYEELSGGQQQLVDTVTAFALHDLVSQNTPSSLLFFDEPFESLNEANTSLVFDLVQSKMSPNKSIFIITHNLAYQGTSHKVIRLRMENGLTKLKGLD